MRNIWWSQIHDLKEIKSDWSTKFVALFIKNITSVCKFEFLGCDNQSVPWYDTKFTAMNLEIDQMTAFYARMALKLHIMINDK